MSVTLVDVQGIEKHFGARSVLDGLSFTVHAGEKIGLIGANGCGKSTLLRILAGEENPDGGDLLRKRGLQVAYLPQNPVFPEQLKVREVLETGLIHYRQRIARFEAVGEALRHAEGVEANALLEEQQEIQSWLDLHQAWNLDHRVQQVADRLGILAMDEPVGNLSGGALKRVALAQVLLQEPDLLLLDEPTNHIDADAVGWLEEVLLAFPGAILLITHDRYFLDRVVSRLFELEHGVLTEYRGGYGAYLVQKQEWLGQQERAQSRLLNLLRIEEAWLQRGCKARTTKQKARIDRVGELQKQKKDLRTREVRLELAPEKRLGGTILELQKLSGGYEDRLLFSNLELILGREERIGIVGANGCGKTTLLKIILGQQAPLSGQVVIGQNSRIGYIDQLRSGLDPELSVAETLGDGDWVTVRGEKRHKIGYLEEFLFTRDEQRKPVSTLSGGERARLLLALLMLQGPNLLILDEPTNDLDIPTMQVLEEALNHFTGSLLVVTHDRYFLDRIATGILHFQGDGQVVRYAGNYSDMCVQRALAAEEAAAARAPQRKAEQTKENSQPKRKAGLSYKEKLELEEIEICIAALEERQSELEQLLADPSRLDGGHQRLTEITAEYSQVETDLMTKMTRWEELELKKAGQ